MVALLVACSGVARAATKDKEARRLYDEATAAFGLGHYAEAAEKYEGAFSLRPDPALLYNAAQAYRVAGNKQRALELYRNYVRLYSDRPNAPDARNHISALEKAIEEEKNAPSPPAKAAPAPVTPLAPASPAAPAAPRSAPVVVAAAPPPSAPPSLVATPAPPQTESASHSHTWIWIAAGAAVLVGGTVAVLLATGGTKYPDATLGTAPGN